MGEVRVYCEQCRVFIELDHRADADIWAAMHVGHGTVWIVPQGDTQRDGTRVS